MTLDQLQSFCAVHEEGGFRSASNRLNKAQSAISVAVKSIEEHLGLKLIDRSEYRPKLTAEGKMFYQKAKGLMENYRELNDFSQLLKQPVELSVSIALTPAIDIELILDKLPSIQEKFPNTHISMHVYNLNGPFEMLESGKADIAITNFFERSLEIEFKEQFDSSLVVVTNKKLIENPEAITLDELKEKTQIIVSDHPLTKIQTNAGILEEAPKWNVTDFATKKQLILRGLGWGTVPYYMVKEELKNNKLYEIACLPKFTTRIFMIRNRSNNIGPVSEYIWNLF